MNRRVRELAASLASSSEFGMTAKRLVGEV